MGIRIEKKFKTCDFLQEIDSVHRKIDSSVILEYISHTHTHIYILI